MRACTCDACGMEFTVDKFDIDKEQLGKDHQIEVISFTCPKCDERFIVAVRDKESARLRDNLQKAQENYKNSYGKGEEGMRQAKKEVGFHKRQLMNYMHSLKKKYLKELRRRG